MGQCLRGHQGKREKEWVARAPLVVQVPAQAPDSVVVRAGLAEQQDLTSGGAAMQRFPLGVSGLAVLAEVCTYPTWWRGWRELGASRAHSAAEAEPEKAGVGAESQARMRYTEF